MSNIPSRLREKPPEKLTKYLSESGDEDGNMPPSINTRINSGDEMRMFLLQDILSKLGAEDAGKIHKSLCEHAVSKRGEGRKEVVQSMQKVPSMSSNTVNRGLESRE